MEVMAPALLNRRQYSPRKNTQAKDSPRAPQAGYIRKARYSGGLSPQNTQIPPIIATVARAMETRRRSESPSRKVLVRISFSTVEAHWISRESTVDITAADSPASAMPASSGGSRD